MSSQEVVHVSLMEVTPTSGNRGERKSITPAHLR
jgi:hypothetical protein